MTNWTVEQLHEHLRLAISVELSTIPPYLYAMYSLQDRESEATRLLRSIVAEEMLHLALAANILVSVGGRPAFLDPDLVPVYPTLLAHHHPDLTIHLEPLSADLIRRTFLVIEQPDPPGSAPPGAGFDSLGEFYAALEAGIERLAGDGDLFGSGTEDRQVAAADFYGPVEFNVAESGGLMAVDDLASARRAIDVIVHQGEGLTDHRWADPRGRELTHYAKLQRLVEDSGRIGAVLPLPIDPRRADWPADVRPLVDLFDACYRALFHVLDALYRPGGSQSALVGVLYLLMADVMAPLAHHLTTIRVSDGHVAAPTFERSDLGPEPLLALVRLAEAAVAAHPSVGDIVSPLLDASALGPLAGSPPASA
jgi:hypothetical protein